MTGVNSSLDYANQSKGIAQRFLRNVLLLDDRASMGPPSILSKRQSALEAPGPESVDAELSAAGQVSAGAESLDAEELVRGFAKLGLMCAPLVPDTDGTGGEGSFVSDVCEAAERADILVLDWWMSGNRNWNKPQLAEKVIRSIIKRDQTAGGRLRLVAIYTGESNTIRILDKLKTLMRQRYRGFDLLPAEVAGESNVDWLSKGPFRLVVIPKNPGALIGCPVLESELAGRLVQEYSELTRGLLRNVAFCGLAALRERAHQLLATFEDDIDPAFLIHRGLLPNPQDAESHVIEILGSEMLAILEEQGAGIEAGSEAIDGWLRHYGPDGFLEVDGLSKWGQSKVAAWSRVLTGGVSHKGRPTEVSGKDVDDLVEVLRSEGTQSLVPRQANLSESDYREIARQANFRFASLMKMRNVHTGDHPHLTLGTVLFRRRDGKYFICIQPKCDSVRLKDSTPFPLLTLSRVNESGKFDLTLKDEKNGNEWICLVAQTKSKALELPRFTPKGTSGMVVATRKAGRVSIRDDKNVEYRWVAAMKDEHALKIVSELSANLARPGPNDSEWLRRNFP